MYIHADCYPDLETFDDFNQMMFFLNNLSYRLIHGKERDVQGEDVPVDGAQDDGVTGSGSICQLVTFRSGPYAGRTAKILIPLPFRLKNDFVIDGERYTVLPGPMAMLVEKSQKPVDNGVLVLVHSTFRNN